MLDPSAFEEGGKYYANDGSGSQSDTPRFRSRENSKSDEATETEIILETLLSLGASNALQIAQFKQQANNLDTPSSSTHSNDSQSLSRNEGIFPPDQQVHFDNGFPTPFAQNDLDLPSPAYFNDPFLPHSNEVVPRSLPPLAPPGISTDNERKFLHHYLHVISARITSPDRGPKNPFRNTFARLATDFPPLLHGILAISAADLSRYDRTISPYEAFLHYQGCVSMLASALNEPSAVIADEALATICLLFLHEVSLSLLLCLS